MVGIGAWHGGTRRQKWLRRTHGCVHRHRACLFRPGFRIGVSGGCSANARAAVLPCNGPVARARPNARSADFRRVATVVSRDVRSALANVLADTLTLMLGSDALKHRAQIDRAPHPDIRDMPIQPCRCGFASQIAQTG